MTWDLGIAGTQHNSIRLNMFCEMVSGFAHLVTNFVGGRLQANRSTFNYTFFGCLARFVTSGNDISSKF